MTLTDADLDQYRELHQLLDQRTTAIRAARAAGDAPELAVQLLDRAWVEMRLRDWHGSGRQGTNWSGHMREDINKAQAVVESLT